MHTLQISKKASVSNGLLLACAFFRFSFVYIQVVRVEWLEHSTPWSQTMCATNCAIPGYFLYGACHAFRPHTVKRKFLCLAFTRWRRRRDSNPRTDFHQSTPLAGEPLQPAWVLLHFWCRKRGSNPYRCLHPADFKSAVSTLPPLRHVVKKKYGMDNPN